MTGSGWNWFVFHLIWWNTFCRKWLLELHRISCPRCFIAEPSVSRTQQSDVLCVLSSVRWQACRFRSCMMEKHGKTAKEMKQSLSTQIGVPQRFLCFLSEDGSILQPNDGIPYVNWAQPAGNSRWWRVYSPTSSSPAGVLRILAAWIPARPPDGICLQGPWFSGTGNVTEVPGYPLVNIQKAIENGHF